MPPTADSMETLSPFWKEYFWRSPDMTMQKTRENPLITAHWYLVADKDPLPSHSIDRNWNPSFSSPTLWNSTVFWYFDCLLVPSRPDSTSKADSFFSKILASLPTRQEWQGDPKTPEHFSCFQGRARTSIAVRLQCKDRGIQPNIESISSIDP